MLADMFITCNPSLDVQAERRKKRRMMGRKPCAIFCTSPARSANASAEPQRHDPDQRQRNRDGGFRAIECASSHIFNRSFQRRLLQQAKPAQARCNLARVLLYRGRLLRLADIVALSIFLSQTGCAMNESVTQSKIRQEIPLAWAAWLRHDYRIADLHTLASMNSIA